MTLLVRELPPLRHSTEVEALSGRRYRWANDEPRPENVPSGERWSSTMPGGHESHDAVLPRLPGIDYVDLKPLSTIRKRDAGGAIIWEGRLERTPRTSGDQMAVSPSAVGWQANLEDDKGAVFLGINRDLGGWQRISRARRIALGDTINPQNDGEVTVDDVSGQPAIKLELSGHLPGSAGGVAESWYDAGGAALVGAVHFEASERRNITAGGATWFFALIASDDDVGGGEVNVSGDLDDAAVAFARYTLAVAQRQVRFGMRWPTAYTADENERWRMVKHVAVVGDHGLPIQEVGAGLDGLLGSDIVTYAVQTFASRLKVTSDSVQPSGFVIPQFALLDRTTAGEIIRQATRFGLQDWAVWDDLTFYWHERGARGRRWRGRVAPARLEETGPQVDRLWESVILTYQDVDGSTRTVGPPGSGADTESDLLKDSDSLNPANELGLTRRTVLSMGIGTAESATQVGYRFLQEQKTLDSSGRATLVGHVEDDRGVLHPYSHVRAGDQISFVDASDSSYRRIVKADHSADSRSCTVDLDSPPEALDALLERLGVVLVPLGLS